MRTLVKSAVNPVSDAILLRKLQELVPGGVMADVLMREITRWKIGGPADFVVRPKSVNEVADTIQFLSTNDIPWLTIGHSSNLLVSDQGIQGVVVQIAHRMSNMRMDGEAVTAQSGIWVPEFARRLGKAGLSGAEHIIGIPGTLGGLICMNGGSQRKGIGENIKLVTCVDRQGRLFNLSREQCGFSYRQSEIQKQNWIVLDAQLEFTRGENRSICRELREILASRRKKFPLKLPNCGSVFVSDPAMYEAFGPPGSIIERCGLKGTRFGDAQISNHHANFIVNLGNAQATDILHLVQLIRKAANETHGCDLQCEVRFVSPDCSIQPAHHVTL